MAKQNKKYVVSSESKNNLSYLDSENVFSNMKDVENEVKMWDDEQPVYVYELVLVKTGKKVIEEKVVWDS